MKNKTKTTVTKKRATTLSKPTLEKMLAATYDKSNVNLDSYQVDAGLSDARVKVYHDPLTNHTVVAHRGSAEARDWYENVKYGLGIESGAGWKHSKEIQRLAEQKYGTANLTTIGHSKGALHAQKFGKHGDIVTLNKPVAIKDLFYKVPEYQTDYTGRGDVVSVLRPFQRGKKEVVLGKRGSAALRVLKKGLLPTILTEHATSTLRRKNN